MQTYKYNFFETLNLNIVLKLTVKLPKMRSSFQNLDITAINHVIRNIYNTTKMSTKDSHFAECEVSLSRFLFWHRLYYWSDRPILCGNLIEFDGMKCLYSKSFRFYKHFDVSEKNMGCLAHRKHVCCIFIIYSQCRQDSEVQNRMIFRDKEASFVNSGQRPQEHFNRHSLL